MKELRILVVQDELKITNEQDEIFDFTVSALHGIIINDCANSYRTDMKLFKEEDKGKANFIMLSVNMPDVPIEAFMKEPIGTLNDKVAEAINFMMNEEILTHETSKNTFNKIADASEKNPDYKMPEYIFCIIVVPTTYPAKGNVDKIIDSIRKRTEYYKDLFNVAIVSASIYGSQYVSDGIEAFSEGENFIFQSEDIIYN